MEEQPVVIVGGGAAGLWTAIGLADRGVPVVMLEAMAPGGRLINLPDVAPGPGWPRAEGPELAGDLTTHALDLGVDIRFDEVPRVRVGDAGLVVDTGDGSLPAAAVALAMGTDDAAIEVDGAEALHGFGLSYCAGCDGPLYRDATVLVVGGSARAARAAQLVAGRGNDVLVVFREAAPTWGRAINTELAADDRVTVLPAGDVVELVAGDGALAAVRIRRDNGDEVVTASGLFFYGALLPRTSPVAGVVALDERGFVVTDENGESDVAGIYAVGDVRQGSPRSLASALADSEVVIAAVLTGLGASVRV
jgi:thioredoxin reductase (NADPH)